MQVNRKNSQRGGENCEFIHIYEWTEPMKQFFQLSK